MRSLCLFSIFQIGFCQVLPAAVIYVKQDGSGLNNGSSWANAFIDLRDAMRSANPGDEIWVAEGEYSPFVSPVPFPQVDTINTYRMPSGVKLYGGFYGNEASLNQREGGFGLTFITFSTRNLIYCENTDSTTLIDGFTFRGGAGEIPFWQINDVFCWDSPNQSICHGGAIYLFSENVLRPTYLTLRDCRFEYNSARYGGAIAAELSAGGGGIRVEKCLFENNTAGHEGTGGALYIYTSTNGSFPMWLKNCTFYKNESFWGTAATTIINNDAGLKFQISKCLFIENKSTLGGGGLYVNGCRVEDCHFERNICGTTLYPVGDGALGGGRNSIIKNCSFFNNKGYYGGAARVGEAVVVNCIFFNNEAKVSGGAILSSGACKFINNTFVNNYSGNTAGAIMHNGGPMNSDTILNCLFWNNVADSVNAMWHFSSTTNRIGFMDYCSLDVSNYQSIVSNYDSGSNDTLLLGKHLSWNSDPMLVDTAVFDFRPKTCSPIVNKGSNQAIVSTGANLDLDNLPRIRFNTVDIGAYETQDSCLVIGSTEPSYARAIATLSPNPVSPGGLLDLQVLGWADAKMEWQVWDSYGRSIQSGNAPLFEKANLSIAAPNAPGIYFVELRSDKQSVWLKFVVQQ